MTRSLRGGVTGRYYAPHWSLLIARSDRNAARLSRIVCPAPVRLHPGGWWAVRDSKRHTYLDN